MAVVKPDSEQSTVRLWKIKAAGSLTHWCVLTHKLQPPVENPRSPQTIWKPLQSLQMCVCIAGRRDWWEQLPGLRPAHHIDSWCSYLSESWRRLQSGSDGGAERQTVRSLREHGSQWILCFLAVTPTGFINSLVRRSKACCGLSAFRSECTSGCFM